MSSAVAGTGPCRRPIERRVGRSTLPSLLLLLLIAAVAGAALGPASDAPPPAPVAEARSAADARLAGLPLYFVENRGRADPRVRYYVEGKRSAVYFTTGGLTMSLLGKDADERWNLKLDFLGAGSRAKPVGASETAARVSHFEGGRADWKAGLPTYSKVAYRDVWPGIDLVYSGTGSRLKYAFHVAPGADPSAIRMGWNGASGVRLDGRGRLAVSTPAGGFVDEAPRTYQLVDGQRRPVASSYALGAGHDYGFNVGSYDRSQPLVIDPAMLVYSGFIGGSGDDGANNVAVDAGGNLYVAGSTASSEATFPERVGPDLSFGGGDADAFVAKVNPSGSALVYAGYIGGSQLDTAIGVAVDAAGAAYVSGITGSSQAQGFPAVVGPDTTFNGGVHDAFVAKVKPDGSGLDYAGYIGGAIPPIMPGIPSEQANGIAVDATGAVYVAGFTPAPPVPSGFPDGDGFGAVPGFDQTPNGITDTFVAKVKANGSGLDYATYIGGSGVDPGTGLSVDAAGNAYVDGFTGSGETTFPDGDGFGAIPGFDRTFNGNPTSPAPDDAYVAKLNAAGTALAYATYIGGSGVEQPFGNAVDSAGSAYVTGHTTSTQATFPDGDGFGGIPGFDRTHNGGTGAGAIVDEGLETDAFVAKLNPAGTGLAYASYIGGAGDDAAVGVDVDVTGRAHVAGSTESNQASFPARNGPDGTFNGGETDAYIAKLSPAGTALDYAGYIGGGDRDSGVGVAVDAAGDAYMAGATESPAPGFPVRAGPDTTQNGPPDTQDAFVAKLRDVPTVLPPPPPPFAPFAGCPTIRANVVIGTRASDVITGALGPDRIFAGAGADFVDARSGDDCVDLAAGNDSGRGGSGADLLLGAAGGDRMTGGSGNDRLRGGSGNDRLSGEGGNDRAAGDAGNDRVSGNSGRDRLNGGSGRDTIAGGSSGDRVAGDRGSDRINGNSGSDRLSGSSANDRVNGGSGNDRVSGSSGRDRLTGGSGGDRLSGGSGNDRVNARDGRRDRIACGSGRDSVIADRLDRVARDCERVRRRGTS